MEKVLFQVSTLKYSYGADGSLNFNRSNLGKHGVKFLKSTAIWFHQTTRTL